MAVTAQSNIVGPITLGSAVGISNIVGPITAAAGTAPFFHSTPVVTGSAVKGQLLSSTAASWSGDAPIVLTYQWQRSPTGTSWSNIVGAVGNAYLLVTADIGFQIRCVVTGTNAVGSLDDPSNSVGPVVDVGQTPPPPPVQQPGSSAPIVVGTLVPRTLRELERRAGRGG